jgi:flavin-dependent dehydrogenase
MPETVDHYDVAIMGGGLAGLTLALQVNQAAPDLSILVIERHAFPAPAAAHKVGEATVEIGAHYLSHTLGLQNLLEATQLRKFGLRLFFGSGSHDDLAKADELGASRLLPAISYQLDRGVLENDLVRLLRARGLTVRDRCSVRGVAILHSDSTHRITAIENDSEQHIFCRWLIDATARTAMVKRSLGLGRPSGHRMCAAWFRLDASISVDDWSADAGWRSRCNGLSRRPSTNHLMGRGYWAWIIPLTGSRTSIGLVADPDVHPLETFNDFGKLRGWFGKQQPLLAAAVDDLTGSLMDFRVLKNLSLDCEKVWSADRWALTGEAGLFADPFYSPGTDFIGLGNTYICSMITTPRTNTELAVHSSIFEKMYQSFFGSTMSLYQDLYRGFGDTRLMVVKSTWDYAYYWSILAWLFFREVLTDLDFLKRAQAELTRIRALNVSMQARFYERARKGNSDQGSGRFFDQAEIPILAELNAELLHHGGGLYKQLANNCERLERVAPLLLALLAGKNAGGKNCSLLGDLQERLN